jgi:hypothetical protein
VIESRLVFNERSATFAVTEAGKEVIARVTEFFLASVKTALMVPNSGVRVRGKKWRPGFTYYPNPSKPGEPPHLITGHLRSGVRSDYAADGLSSRVGLDASVPYGLWLEFGIPGGKMIYPKVKKALAWVNNQGQVVIRKRVRQGAIKARPWFFATLKKVMPQLRILAGG